MLSLNSSLLLQVTQAIVDNFVMFFSLTAQAQPHGPIAPKAMPSSPSTESLLYFGWLSKTYQRMFQDIYKSTLLNDLNVLSFFELFFFPGNSLNSFLSVASSPRYYRRQI